jgi:uncharacterized protein (DUF305 family)
VRLTSRLAIPAASAVLILALSACGSSDDSHSTMSGAGTTSSSMAEGMTGWLAQWGASESSGQMDHGGMMSDDDMSSLMGASGPEFNQMWLTMMIEHHEGAVEMAQDVLATTSNPEVEKLATAVVEGQEKEITTMKGMLG